MKEKTLLIVGDTSIRMGMGRKEWLLSVIETEMSNIVLHHISEIRSPLNDGSEEWVAEAFRAHGFPVSWLATDNAVEGALETCDLAWVVTGGAAYGRVANVMQMMRDAKIPIRIFNHYQRRVTWSYPHEVK